MKTKLVILSAILTLSSITAAQTVVTMKSFSGDGQQITIGTVTLTDSQFGVIIKPDLQSLTPGMHGFHLHENPSCENGGKGAGGHYDPQKTMVHMGPFDTRGHLGDLPALYVDQGGHASMPMLAPRLTEKDFKGHAIIIHQGGDNYSDNPKPLGGGGARVACGVIQ